MDSCTTIRLCTTYIRFRLRLSNLLRARYVLYPHRLARPEPIERATPCVIRETLFIALVLPDVGIQSASLLTDGTNLICADPLLSAGVYGSGSCMAYRLLELQC